MKIKLGDLGDKDTWQFIFILIGLSSIAWVAIKVLSGFASPIILAIILCLTIWPAFKLIRTKLKISSTLSAFITVLLLTLLFIVPLALIGGSLVDDFDKIKELALKGQDSIAVAPMWVSEIPLIGKTLSSAWPKDISGISEIIANNADTLSNILLNTASVLASGVIDLSMTLIIAFFLMCSGEEISRAARGLTEQLTGNRGLRLLETSQSTMISVVYGILGAALAQGVLAGIGFAIAGVPAAALLGFLSFAFALLPMGTAVVWLPAAIWLFVGDNITMGVFMIAWGLMVSSVDNFIRPYFIGMGAELPFLLILLGVLGGLIAFGFLGLFIGPVALALVYTLALDILNEQKTKSE